MARVSMWPMWGLPLAVGGPSKKDQTSRPSRCFMLFWKMSFSFQNLMTSFSSHSRIIGSAFFTNTPGQ